MRTVLCLHCRVLVSTDKVESGLTLTLFDGACACFISMCRRSPAAVICSADT